MFLRVLKKRPCRYGKWLRWLKWFTLLLFKYIIRDLSVLLVPRTYLFASQSEGEGTGDKAGQNASECNKMHFNEPRLTNFLHVVTVVMKATSLPPSNEDVPSPQLRLPLSEFPRSTMGDLPMPRFLERWFQMEAMTTNQKEYINSYSVKTKIERYFQLS